jgi:hypothetical protein
MSSTDLPPQNTRATNPFTLPNSSPAPELSAPPLPHRAQSLPTRAPALSLRRKGGYEQIPEDGELVTAFNGEESGNESPKDTQVEELKNVDFRDYLIKTRKRSISDLPPSNHRAILSENSPSSLIPAADLPAPSYLDSHHGSLSRRTSVSFPKDGLFFGRFSGANRANSQIIAQKEEKGEWGTKSLGRSWGRAVAGKEGEGRQTLTIFRTNSWLTGPRWEEEGLLTPEGSEGEDEEGEEDKENKPVDATTAPRPSIVIKPTSPSTTPLEVNDLSESTPLLISSDISTPLASPSSPSSLLPSSYGTPVGVPPHLLSFITTTRGGPAPAMLASKRSILRLCWLQLRSLIISTIFLLFIVVWALATRAIQAAPKFLLSFILPKEEKEEWDDGRYDGEKCVKSVKYYAENCGYGIEEQSIWTDDGYELKIHKVLNRQKGTNVGGWPVVIQHGRFRIEIRTSCYSMLLIW